MNMGIYRQKLLYLALEFVTLRRSQIFYVLHISLYQQDETLPQELT